MPDVGRCPFCNSGDRREETWRGVPAYSFSCGTVFCANGEAALRYFACYTREKEREERAIRKRLAAARAEAKALRKYIDALEAENERLRQIEAAARTLVDTAFEVAVPPDEYVYQAVRVDHFYTLAALLKGEEGSWG